MSNLFFNPDPRFDSKVINFPDTLYRINDPTSKIHRLLYALLEIGVGQAKGMQDLALISENNLASTTGQELDQYFQMFGIRRTNEFSSENSMHPESEDARFRTAIAKFLQALSLGGTATGMRLMAEASSGFKCQLIEPWRNADNANGRARLMQDGMPVGNEILIFIYPDIFLDSDELNQLRVRVISNCKIIAPLHTTVTVEIKEAIEFSNFIPSYVSSGSFSYIQDSDYLELLSQENEIDLNNSVINVQTYETNDDYSNFIGNVNSNIDNSSITLLVEEQNIPPTNTFYINIVENTNNEIVFVKNRKFYSNPNIFVYEIERSKTQSFPFSSNAMVMTNISTVYFQSKNTENIFEDWKPIPLADCYANYPFGKFPNDTSKYDANGNYLFEWSDQAEFNTWFTNYVTKIGGEVKNNKYRYRMNIIENSMNASVSSNNLNKIIGLGYEYVRPIPKPRN